MNQDSQTEPNQRRFPVILRWLAIGSLFLVINAITIILLDDDGRYKDSPQAGLPEDVLQLINTGHTF